MADLPDYYTQIVAEEAEAYTIRGGADASKSASPSGRDVYLATDTEKIYFCCTVGSWSDFLATHAALTTGVHGVGAGAIVGTTLTQTLTNKTLTTPVIATLYQDAAKTKLITFPASSQTLIGRTTTDTLTNKTLTSPAINGTVTTTGLIMPAFTLAGAMDAGDYNITSVGDIEIGGQNEIICDVDNQHVTIRGGTKSAGHGSLIRLWGKDHANTGRFAVFTPDAAGSADTARLQISGKLATAVATCSALTWTGFKLSGALNANSQQINNLPAPSAANDAARKAYVDAAATKELFVPVTGGSVAKSLKGDFVSILIDATAEAAWISFKVPHNFSSLTAAEVIVVANTTATHRFTLQTDYGADGESYNTHSESSASEDFSLTADKIDGLDISGILGSLAADDYVGVWLDGRATNTPNCHILGVRLKYS